MPISTPDFLVQTYANDKDHFQHVLECLFIPAVKKIGLNPIRPIAKGADVIHAEIIQNLEKADIVLCDMSFLNANVFFELGIRTAIGKPVCVVKDDATPKIPFDMTVVNCQEYASSLPAWALDKEIEKLAEHLKSCLERSAGQNMLWKYFSLSQRAQLTPSKSKDETHDRLAMLSAQVEGLSRKLDNVRQPNSVYPPPIPDGREVMTEQMAILKERRSQLTERLAKFAAGKSFHITRSSGRLFDNTVQVSIEGQPDETAISEMRTIAAALGYELYFVLPQHK
jgi:hypothetical protein